MADSNASLSLVAALRGDRFDRVRAQIEALAERTLRQWPSWSEVTRRRVQVAGPDHALGTDLARHGAPLWLVAEAMDIADLTAATLERLGAAREANDGQPNHARAEGTLAEFALDNARIGCGARLFGAMMLSARAREARDVGVSEVLADVAWLEMRRTQLAYRIDEWARRTLGPEWDARLDAARTDAWQQQLRAFAPEGARRMTRELGELVAA